ncbi:TnsD family Tn7-like transposition protein [Deefgea piscis]|uniref:TnsD family Tn7-like transposition protein n=1 Tax=Deefgea piscis TaxID=2739061 RepID=UPI001C816555|nr:TniQ family protein [Deefgea piscis]QZA82261.1 TnsD family transposase [Deefgea piscis]
MIRCDAEFPTKFYYLPGPYPDELIGSLFIRIGHHLGVSVKKLHSMLSYLPKSKWPLFFHSPLAPLANALSIPSEILLYRHTPFSYVTAFDSPETIKRLALGLISNQQMASALSHSAAIGGVMLRYCEECIKEDKHEFGEDFWHRKHNIPFITVCAKHQQLLKFVSLKRSGISTSQLPSQFDGEYMKAIFPEYLQQIVENFSLKIFDSEVRKSPQEWQSYYRARAIERGFPVQGSGLAACALSREFERFYGSSVLASLKLPLRSESQSWVACLLRQSETSDVTAKHILMNVFLKYGPTPAIVHTKPPGPKELNFPAIDSQFAEAIKKYQLQLKPGNRLTVKQLLIDLKILETVRHHRASLPETHKQLEFFRRSEFSARQVGGRPRKAQKINT